MMSMVDNLNLDEQLAKELEPIPRARFNVEGIIASAQRQTIIRMLRQEMVSPSDGRIRHFAGRVHSGRLSSTDMRRYERLVKEAWRELVDREITERLKRPDERVGASPLDWDSEYMFSEKAVEDSVVIPIFAEYHGRRFEAKLLVKENLNWHEGWIYTCFEGEWTSHKLAALKAARKVNPGINNVNGSKFWRFIHPDSGAESPIGMLFKNPELCRVILDAL